MDKTATRIFDGKEIEEAAFWAITRTIALMGLRGMNHSAEIINVKMLCNRRNWIMISFAESRMSRTILTILFEKKREDHAGRGSYSTWRVSMITADPDAINENLEDMEAEERKGRK